MLDDLGLVEVFDNHAQPFEEASGHLAGVFGAGAGWPPHRCTRAAEVIVQRMREWPRLSLTVEFDACFARQAARKPESAAGHAVRSGIAQRLASNLLERE
jgi:hypothetical protein